jgi:hypothetical protein
MSSEEYRRNAAHCLGVAEQLTDLESKAALVEMASNWLPKPRRTARPTCSTKRRRATTGTMFSNTYKREWQDKVSTGVGHL